LEIKLRARLSAYSKVDALGGVTSDLPVAGEDNVCDVLGVGANGEYTLLQTVSREDIDELFKDLGDVETVEKGMIDTLFEGIKEDDDVGRVSKADIDTLFN
jgi:hypothetical protein